MLLMSPWHRMLLLSLALSTLLPSPHQGMCVHVCRSLSGVCLFGLVCSAKVRCSVLQCCVLWGNVLLNFLMFFLFVPFFRSVLAWGARKFHRSTHSPTCPPLIPVTDDKQRG